MSGLRPLAKEMATAGVGVIDGALHSVRRRLEPPARPPGEAGEPAGELPRGLVLRPALLGFAAMVAIAVGASLPSSPFKLEMPGVWFFGVPSTAGASSWGVYFTLAAVYGGLLLLMRVWWGMTRLYARCPGVPVKRMMWVFALWSHPDAGDRPAVQPRRVFVCGPGRDGQSPHEPLSVRALRAGQQFLHRPGRPAVGQRPGPVWSPLPPDRRLLHPDHLPQRVGHDRPAPAAVAAGRGADRLERPGWPASTTATGPSCSP